MDKLERARELFRNLEERRLKQGAEIAWRNFCVEQTLSEIRA